MNIVSIPFNGKHLMINYRDTMRPFGDTEKNMDLQVIKEIFEENVYHLTVDKLNGSKVVIDLGGHIGTFSLMAAALGAEVIALEPNKDNADLLEMNAAWNNFEHKIKVIRNAVYPNNSPVEMDNDYSDSMVKELAGMATWASKVSQKERVETFMASTITLEKIMSDIPEVDFLKIDIEWSEYKIIPTITEDMMKKIKFIAIEFHGVDKATFGEMIAHLTKGFCIEILGHHDRGGFVWARRY
jgi:FkbM family methyltransferase